MTRKCLEHPKVRKELHPGGADEEAKDEMENWQKEYRRTKTKCNLIGLKTDVLDIELGKCKEPVDVIANRDDLIEKLVKKETTTSAGRTFKYTGTTMVNGPDLLAATRLENEHEAAATSKKKEELRAKADQVKKDAIAVYNRYVERGKPLDKYGHPDLEKVEFTAIIKCLFPILLPKEAASVSYASKTKAKVRLHRLKVENKIFWEDEMQKIIRNKKVEEHVTSSETETDLGVEGHFAVV